MTTPDIKTPHRHGGPNGKKQKTEKSGGKANTSFAEEGR